MSLDWRDIKPNNPIDNKKHRDWRESRPEAESMADKIKAGVSIDYMDPILAEEVQLILMRRYLKARGIIVPLELL